MHKNNVIIARKFELLADLYEQTGDQNRAFSFSRAAQAALDLNDENIAQVYKARKISGIGDSSIKEIQEILSSGTSKRIEDLMREGGYFSEDDARINILDFLVTHVDMNMSDAIRLIILHGITSLTVLRKLVNEEKITHRAVKEGLETY